MFIRGRIYSEKIENSRHYNPRFMPKTCGMPYALEPNFNALSRAEEKGFTPTIACNLSKTRDLHSYAAG